MLNKLSTYVNSITKSFVTSPAANIQKKTFSPFMSFVNYLALNGYSNLSAFQSMQYYIQVSPLFDAIDRIATEVSNISLYVQNLKTEKFTSLHPVLDLLEKPNTDMIGLEFLHQLAAYYLITGNAYIVATGDVNKPPLELFAISPEYITLTPDERDGYTKIINYTSNARSIQFRRTIVDGRYRFYEYVDGEATPKREIWHIRKFNPIRGVTNNYGLSPEASCYYEIEQYIKAGIHNLSLLNRGGRPSGALTAPETLAEEAFARLQEQMDRFYAGAENAGRMLLLDSGIEYKEMGMSNKDMDFEQLKKDLTVKLYNVYKVPIPLVSPDSMTYSNYATSVLAFYDFAVLPLETRLTRELTAFLNYRYNMEKTDRITYNKDTISALQLRRNEELTLVKNLGVNTINEIRSMRGDEPANGGDDIYGTAAAYPIARVGGKITDEERVRDNAEDSEKVRKLDYLLRAKRSKTVDGKELYTNEELKQLAKRYEIE